jgi:DNA polymerase III psi subunit
MSDTHMLIEVLLYNLMWSFEVTVNEMQCVQFILLPMILNINKHEIYWNLNRKSSIKLTEKQVSVHMQQFMHLKINFSELPDLNIAVCNTVYYQIHRF